MKIPLIQPQEDPSGLKNHFMNGSFAHWQRGLSLVSLEGQHADRFSTGYAISPGRATYTRESSIIPPNGLSLHSMKIQTSIIDAAPAAGALGLLRHRMEGNYFRALRGKTFYLKGKIYATTAGNWTIAFSNATEANRWLDQISVPVANTWTDFILDVTHNPAIGTWEYGTNAGLIVAIPLVAGTSHQTSAANKRNWNHSTGWVVTGSANQNFHSSLSNIAYLSQLQLVTNPDEVFVPSGGSVVEEFRRCQRYFEKSYEPDVAPGTIAQNPLADYQLVASQQFRREVRFTVHKRTAPIGLAYNGVTGTISSVNVEGNNYTANCTSETTTGMQVRTSTTTVSGDAIYQWTANAEF